MSSLDQRIAQLEKRLSDFGPRCPTCGGPDPVGKRIAYAPLTYCIECDGPIDRDGMPLGGRTLKVIDFGAKPRQDRSEEPLDPLT